MKREPLQLIHQDILQKRFKHLSLKISEYSFANLYLFRQIHEYEILQMDDEFFIYGITRNQQPFILLTSPPSETSLSLLLSSIESPILFFIPHEWLTYLLPFQSFVYSDESDTDYLLKKEKLATYLGRHLDKKRNLVKQFHASYSVHYTKLEPNHQEQAIQLLDQWQAEQLLDKTKTDYYSCHEAIFLLETLQLQGFIWSIDQKVVGLAIGEVLTPNCFVIHFFKGLKKFKGLHQVMYQQLALSLPEAIEWINLEEDLGIEGLRQAKKSYHPDLLLMKWRVPLKK